MRANYSTFAMTPLPSLVSTNVSPAVSLMPHLSWAKVDAAECDVEHDLKFILCEQDFTSLCGIHWPEDGSQNFPDPLTLQPSGDISLTAVYFQGRDGDGNCVKVCVIRDANATH